MPSLSLPDPKNPRPSADILQTQDEPGGFMLASSEMVIVPVIIVGGQAVAVYPLLKLSCVTTCSLVPLCPRRSDASHLVIILQVPQEKGYFQKTAKMSSCVGSSAQVYQEKWSSLCGWCYGRDIILVSTTIH